MPDTVSGGCMSAPPLPGKYVPRACRRQATPGVLPQLYWRPKDELAEPLEEKCVGPSFLVAAPSGEIRARVVIARRKGAVCGVASSVPFATSRPLRPCSANGSE